MSINQLVLTDTAALEELGSRLAVYRLQRNLTQAALAREAGVSRNTVERIERGVSVDLKLAIRVLRALGLLEAVMSSLPTSEPGPMALLAARGRPRLRARGRAVAVAAALDTDRG